MQSWCRTWPPNGSSRIRAKQKLLRKHKGACKSSWSRIGSLKSFTLTIPWNLAKPVKIFPGTIVRQRHTDLKQMGLLGEQYAEWKKVRPQCCCNQVWMKNGGQIPWNAIPICETFKISCLVGRHHMKGGSECSLTDQWYRLEQWSNITLSLRKTYPDYTSSVQKSCQVYYSVIFCMREESGKETLWSQTLKNWPSELHARRLNAKEVLTSMKGDNFICPVADGTVKTAGGDRRLKPSTLIRDRHERGEEQVNQTDHLQDDSTLVYFGRFQLSPSRGTQSQTVRAERRIMSHSVEAHRRYQKQHIRHWMYCWRKILMITGTWMEKRELSDAWTGFTRFILLNEKPPDRYTWSGKTRQCMARYVEAYVWCSEVQSKANVDHRETKARLRQTIAWEMLLESWELRCQQQCLVKHQ